MADGTGPEGRVAQATKNALAPLDGLHVLIVEDEPIIAVDLQLTAEDAGAVVTRLPTQGEALRHLAEMMVDAAVLDYTLPSRRTAGPIARELTARGVPFVLYSGNLDQFGMEIDRLGAPVIAKPAAVHRVLAKLAELVSQKT